MSKDKETKKLDTEELEKREAPFMPIVERSGEGGGGTPAGTRRFTPGGHDRIPDPDLGHGGGHDKPILEKPRP